MEKEGFSEMKTSLRYSLSSLKVSRNKSGIDFGEEGFAGLLYDKLSSSFSQFWSTLFLNCDSKNYTPLCLFDIICVKREKSPLAPSSYFEDFRWPNIIIRGRIQWLRNHHVAPIFADSPLDWISICWFCVIFLCFNKWLDKKMQVNIIRKILN